MGMDMSMRLNTPRGPQAFVFDAKAGLTAYMKGGSGAATTTGSPAITDVGGTKYLSMTVGDTCTYTTSAALTSVLTGGGALTAIVRMRPGFAPADIDNNVYESIITPAANVFRLLYFGKTAGGSPNIATFDGTTAASVTFAWLVNTAYDVAVRVYDSAGTMKYQPGFAPVSTGVWTWGTAQNYDGAFAVDGTTRFFYNIAHANKLAHAAIFGRDLGQAGIAAYCAAL